MARMLTPAQHVPGSSRKTEHLLGPGTVPGRLWDRFPLHDVELGGGVGQVHFLPLS